MGCTKRTPRYAAGRQSTNKRGVKMSEYKLTPRENLIEVMKGGKPERFVKQYEAFNIPFRNLASYRWRNNPRPGEINKVNNWGVTVSWAEGQPGAFPVHTPDKIVCKDIEEWQDYVTAPDPYTIPEAEWEKDQEVWEQIDRKEQFAMAFVAPGVFEQCHYLCEIQNVLIAFYECPDELKDLIKYITEWELKLAEVICDHLHPDGVFHHDDWGTQINTFTDPDMFAEFFLDPYKEIYGYYKSRGVELIAHHSDSYAETLVPYMIEMGIDVWQGVMNTNDIPGMIEKYGKDITFMGGIDSASVDYEGWTREEIAKQVKRTCDENGPLYFIPSLSQGLPISTFPGVYDTTQEEIEKYSKIYWAEHNL